MSVLTKFVVVEEVSGDGVVVDGLDEADDAVGLQHGERRPQVGLQRGRAQRHPGARLARHDVEPDVFDMQ